MKSIHRNVHLKIRFPPSVELIKDYNKSETIYHQKLLFELLFYLEFFCINNRIFFLTENGFNR